MSDEIESLLREALEGRKKTRLYRARLVQNPADPTHFTSKTHQKWVNFASNNYLGLTHHPRLIEAANEANRKWGTGSGAAGLVTGYTEEHEVGEAALAAWKGCERAVLLPSGYQANVAAVQAVAAVGEATGRGVRFLLDKLCHASLIDAVRATGRVMRVFPHNGMGKLSRLLAEADEGELQVVVTESIFSMDGDAADLLGIAQLKQKHSFVLVLDEAHASGVYGPGGAGLAAEVGLSSLADLTTVTLSKGMGSVGGAVCGSGLWCEAVVNFGRASIYTTNVPASVAAVARAAIGVMRDEPERQARVRELARRVRGEFKALGLEVPGGDSPIIPVILGEEGRAIGAGEMLRERGMVVGVVRPPTVAAGTSRLRVTVSSGHSDGEVAGLVGGLGELRDREVREGGREGITRRGGGENESRPL